MTNIHLQRGPRPSRRTLVVAGIIALVLVVAAVVGRAQVWATLGWAVSHGGPAFGGAFGWLGQRLTDFINLRPETQIILIQTLVVVIGGAWVFYRFRRQRVSQPTLRMLGSARLVKRGPEKARLFVRVHLTNISSVNLEDAEATVTLLPASDTLDKGRLSLSGPPQVEDPFLPIFGWFSDESEPPVIGWDPERGEMEPHECVDSEVAFALDKVPELIALRFTVIAHTHWWIPWNRRPFRWLPWRRHPYKWGSYGFLSAEEALKGYQSLAFEAHAGD